MDLDLKVYWAPCAQLYSLTVTKCTNPLPIPPHFGQIYEGDIGQPRKTTFLCDPLVSKSIIYDLGSLLPSRKEEEIEKHCEN
jgi:hypothetical protein